MSKNLPLTKILLSLAAVAVVAVAAVGGTFANFTATPTTIASNAFASGSLTMSRSGSGAIFSSAAMKIGDTATGSNAGDNALQGLSADESFTWSAVQA